MFVRGHREEVEKVEKLSNQDTNLTLGEGEKKVRGVKVSSTSV